jgi:tRNA nucleotidyltransferase (CCA-adding enzyme)
LPDACQGDGRPDEDPSEVRDGRGPLPNGLKLDIATARLEYYDSPAALPTIELSSIKKDLYRRDFTINTLAVRLNTKHFGELIDFFGGVRDIKERTIRILHNLSFVEDPTRVYRAIRFEQRFGFPISKHTLNLIKTAVSMRLFDKLSGERVMGELMPMFGESDPGRVVKRMNELGLLKFIHPELKYGVEMERLFAGIGEALSWFRLLYLDSTPDVWFVYFSVSSTVSRTGARGGLRASLHPVPAQVPVQVRSRTYP